METMEPVTRQSIGLPSISHLDPDRIKREEIDHQRNHSAVAMASPLHPFAPPLHLHSNHQLPPASSASASLAGLLSPSDLPIASSNDKEPQRHTPRQSLPSIHEALGAEPPRSYASAVPPLSALSSAPKHYPPSSATTSPSDQRTRNFSSDFNSVPSSANSFSHPRSPFLTSSASQAPPPPPPQALAEPPLRPSFTTSPHNSKLPTLHPIKTTQSPPASTTRPNHHYSSYPQAPTSHDNSNPQSATSMNHHYSYAHYPSGYPVSAPATSAQSSAYPPPASTYSAPPRYPPPTSWREGSEMVAPEEKKINRSSLAPYGESVKRHLESFDLEASLNEMADGAGHIAEFSKVYRQRAHDNQRIGMTPQSMPRVEEVDDMLKQSERIHMSLQRMRDVVHNHHQASIAEPPRDHYRQSNGYDHDNVSNYGDDVKSAGGFAGGDSKTRKRGRAAPPGRCHSCNRAETPEWRRGPDGARTLCNACGLHYAKLTRKMGGKQAMASSNLRPKVVDHGSPSI